MILVFDCETTGLPTSWQAPMNDLNNWPRVIQLAWILSDNTGNELNRNKLLIKPDGWQMPTGQFWIDNGFSQEISEVAGIPIADALKLFIDDVNECSVMVSHNMAFDYNVVGAELLRTEIRASKKPVRICTKEKGTNVCQIPSQYKTSFKWPKLIELYQFLFKEGFEDAHDALADVIACKRCFFEMLRQNHIQLPIAKS